MRAALAALALLLAAGCGSSAEEAAARDARAQRYAAAERAFSRRQHPQASQAFAAIAADPTFDRPTRALARHRMGVIALRAGRADEAREMLRSVAEFGVDERTALAMLDLAGAAPDRPTRRAAALDVARRFPDTGAAEMVVESLAREAERGEASALIDALSALAAAHRETTIGPVATRWQAHLEAETLADLPAARRTLRRLTQRWPDSGEVPAALWMLAELEERRGAWQRAQQTWDALAGLHPDRGWIWMGSERGPKSDDAALRAARVTWHGIGDLPDAIRRYRDAIDLYGDGILGDEMRYELAVALFAADRSDAAGRVLRDLIEYNPQSRYVDRSRAMLDGQPPPTPQVLRPKAMRREGGA